MENSWKSSGRVLVLIGGTLLVAQLADALRYKPEGSGFDSRCCHWNFLLI
jgi:hypothetical protein